MVEQINKNMSDYNYNNNFDSHEVLDDVDDLMFSEIDKNGTKPRLCVVDFSSLVIETIFDESKLDLSIVEDIKSNKKALGLEQDNLKDGKNFIFSNDIEDKIKKNNKKLVYKDELGNENEIPKERIQFLDSDRFHLLLNLVYPALLQQAINSGRVGENGEKLTKEPNKRLVHNSVIKPSSDDALKPFFPSMEKTKSAFLSAKEVLISTILKEAEEKAKDAEKFRQEGVKEKKAFESSIKVEKESIQSEQEAAKLDDREGQIKAEKGIGPHQS